MRPSGVGRSAGQGQGGKGCGRWGVSAVDYVRGPLVTAAIQADAVVHVRRDELGGYSCRLRRYGLPLILRAGATAQEAMDAVEAALAAESRLVDGSHIKLVVNPNLVMPIDASKEDLDFPATPEYLLGIDLERVRLNAAQGGKAAP